MHRARRGAVVQFQVLCQAAGMNENALLSRITSSTDICHGKPCIRGLRYPVEMILELLASGMSQEEILKDYEDLQKEDILACLEYASKLTHVNSIYRISA